MLFFSFRGVGPVRILQGVAAGLIGRDAARAGGWQTALLGLAVHFCIATAVVAVYFLASRKLSLLERAPIVCGVAYGIGVWLVMNFLILPLTAAGPPRFTTIGVVNGLFAHIFCVGLPTALLCRRQFASTRSTAAST
jgi:uncharacterized membrane protein YagU involved in acid resistance